MDSVAGWADFRVERLKRIFSDLSSTRLNKIFREHCEVLSYIIIVKTAYNTL